MPKLCDIVKPGVPCKVRREARAAKGYEWDGTNLLFGEERMLLGAVLFNDDWHLDEPIQRLEQHIEEYRDEIEELKKELDEMRKERDMFREIIGNAAADFRNALR